MIEVQRRFKDLDLSFTPHPATGDLVTIKDDIAIKNSVRNLLMTRHFERAFHSEIGSNISRLLFENPTPAVVAVLRQEIIDVINNFEPRVRIQDIQIFFSPDFNEIKITVIFVILNTTRPLLLQFTLNRTR